jgi:type I restriction-modification system DNA methylase subunit/predicted DNA-binding transcriptional regulator AlpA
MQTRSEDSGPLISLTDVAKMAQVSRPAVSNWRRRYEDFPQPVQETGATSLFQLAEVERWMRRHGKRFVVPSVDQRVWSAFGVVRGAVLPEDAAEMAAVLLGLSVLADRLGVAERTTLDEALREESDERLLSALERLVRKVEWPGLLDETVADVLLKRFRPFRPFLGSVYSLTNEYGPGAVFEALVAMLARSSHSSGKAETGTPPTMARLMATLAEPISGTVYDPACGRGALLYAAHQRVNPGTEVRLVGRERSRALGQTAQLRLLVHGISGQVDLDDSLTIGAESDLRADLVLADPPFGMSWQQERLPNAFQLPFGIPPRSSAELAWLQHSISRLEPTGTALHVTPLGPLFRPGAEAHIRRALVTSGLVQSIIALPPGLYGSQTSIPVALWIVGPRPRSTARHGVLFIDAARLGRRVGGRTEVSDVEISDITQRYRAWRDSADSGVIFNDMLHGSLRHCTLNVDRLVDEDCNLQPARWLADPPADPGLTLNAISTAERNMRSTRRKLATAAHPDVSAAITLAKDAAPQLTIREMVDRRLVTVTRARRVDPALIGSGDTPLIRPQDLNDDWSVSPSERIDPDLLDYQPDLSHANDVVVLADGPRPRAAVDSIGGSVVAAPLYVLRWAAPGVDPLVTASLITMALNQGQLVGGVLPRVQVHGLQLPDLDAQSARWLAKALRALIEERRLASEIVATSREFTDRIVDLARSGHMRVGDSTVAVGRRP